MNIKDVIINRAYKQINGIRFGKIFETIPLQKTEERKIFSKPLKQRRLWLR